MLLGKNLSSPEIEIEVWLSCRFIFYVVTFVDGQIHRYMNTQVCAWNKGNDFVRLTFFKSNFTCTWQIMVWYRMEPDFSLFTPHSQGGLNEALSALLAIVSVLEIKNWSEEQIAETKSWCVLGGVWMCSEGLFGDHWELFQGREWTGFSLTLERIHPVGVKWAKGPKIVSSK